MNLQVDRPAATGGSRRVRCPELRRPSVRGDGSGRPTRGERRVVPLCSMFARTAAEVTTGDGAGPLGVTVARRTWRIPWHNAAAAVPVPQPSAAVPVGVRRLALARGLVLRALTTGSVAGLVAVPLPVVTPLVEGPDPVLAPVYRHPLTPSRPRGPSPAAGNSCPRRPTPQTGRPGRPGTLPRPWTTCSNRSGSRAAWRS